MIKTTFIDTQYVKIQRDIAEVEIKYSKLYKRNPNDLSTHGSCILLVKWHLNWLSNFLQVEWFPDW